MVPGKYKLNNHYKGDTFDGVKFTLKDSTSNTPINLTSATIKTQFRRVSKTGELMTSLTIGAGITVDNAVGGVFSIDELIIDWEPNTYFYDVQITFLGGVVKTYIEGTITILQDVTYV